jgi:P-type E1-E2 ATPase
VIVKRLNAIQNFGAMDVLCTDKTGTLTQDKIILMHHPRPNHVGAAIARFKRAGRIEERDGKLYAR